MNEQEREIAWIRRLGSRGDACRWGPGGEGGDGVTAFVMLFGRIRWIGAALTRVWVRHRTRWIHSPSIICMFKR
ncbi:hypothetical protein HanPSC8_Chr17g0765861 [Helianthus annuus]|nr:hypothetical protein HanPSC8_Chr17g0765861 [Helianthus annuus]